MVTPIIFIALFLTAAALIFNHLQLSAENDKQVSANLLSAGARNEYWKKMISCSARAYETIKNERQPGRLGMQALIEQRIQEHDHITTSVLLENVSGNVKVTIVPQDYLVKEEGLLFNYTGKTYSTLLGEEYTFTG